jgi:3-dehydroquinate dehydratase
MPTIEHKISIPSINISAKQHFERNKMLYAFSCGVIVGILLRGKQSINLSINSLPT